MERERKELWWLTETERQRQTDRQNPKSEGGRDEGRIRTQIKESSERQRKSNTKRGEVDSGRHLLTDPPTAPPSPHSPAPHSTPLWPPHPHHHSHTRPMTFATSRDVCYHPRRQEPRPQADCLSGSAHARASRERPHSGRLAGHQEDVKPRAAPIDQITCLSHKTLSGFCIATQ